MLATAESITQAHVNRFGKRFLDVVDSFCAKHPNAPRDVPQESKGASKKDATPDLVSLELDCDRSS